MTSQPISGNVAACVTAPHVIDSTHPHPCLPSKGLLQIYKANLATMDKVLQQLLSEFKAAFALEAAELEVRTSRTEAGPVRCEVGCASVSAQPQTLCTPMQV